MAKAKLEGKTSDADTIGVSGESETHIGVKGVTRAPGFAAVYGHSENHTQQAGPGVMGKSDGVGVMGESNTWHGVLGLAAAQLAVTVCMARTPKAALAWLGKAISGWGSMERA